MKRRSDNVPKTSTSKKSRFASKNEDNEDTSRPSSVKTSSKKNETKHYYREVKEKKNSISVEFFKYFVNHFVIGTVGDS